jgi:hypothetical protein
LLIHSGTATFPHLVNGQAPHKRKGNAQLIQLLRHKRCVQGNIETAKDSECPYIWHRI